MRERPKIAQKGGEIRRLWPVIPQNRFFRPRMRARMKCSGAASLAAIATPPPSTARRGVRAPPRSPSLVVASPRASTSRSSVAALAASLSLVVVRFAFAFRFRFRRFAFRFASRLAPRCPGTPRQVHVACACSARFPCSRVAPLVSRSSVRVALVPLRVACLACASPRSLAPLPRSLRLLAFALTIAFASRFASPARSRPGLAALGCWPMERGDRTGPCEGTIGRDHAR